MFNHFSSIPYPKFKLAIVVLLTFNVAIYAIADTLISAFDALAWLMLLILYELETNGANLLTQNSLNRARTVLIAVIALVFISYVHEGEWLDVVNSSLWFVLIALLELEVRWPDIVVGYQKSYWLVTGTVFAGLIVMVILWGLQSAWLDVYDAVLWIVAFGFIEVDIIQVLQRTPAKIQTDTMPSIDKSL
jgi:hypothetical protein